MKPIIILPPNVMSDENIKLLRDNDLCVVVSEDPGAVKFIDPLPAVSSRSQMEHAAIQLSRKLLNGQSGSDLMNNNRGFFAALYFDVLQKGSPLDRNETPEEREAWVKKQAKEEELRRLGREEAKAEKEAAKAAKAKK